MSWPNEADASWKVMSSSPRPGSELLRQALNGRLDVLDDVGVVVCSLQRRSKKDPLARFSPWSRSSSGVDRRPQQLGRNPKFGPAPCRPSPCSRGNRLQGLQRWTTSRKACSALEPAGEAHVVAGIRIGTVLVAHGRACRGRRNETVGHLRGRKARLEAQTLASGRSRRSVKVAERMIEANGVELCTESFGDPADPPILLVMGIGASMLWWEESFCRLLVQGDRFVIRYDHRDTGRSVTYEPGRPEYTGADLVAPART
jgi:hypothetical protein